MIFFRQILDLYHLAQPPSTFPVVSPLAPSRLYWLVFWLAIFVVQFHLRRVASRFRRREMRWGGAVGHRDSKSVETISFFLILVELFHFFIFRLLAVLANFETVQESGIYG